jgi:hypothetical protein
MRMLMVTATSTDGQTSTRRATDGSVGGITTPGSYWAVETKRDRITSATIAWFFATEEQAEAKVAEVNTGHVEWKDSGQRNYDARIVPARAYEQTGEEPTRRKRRPSEASPKLCPEHFTTLPATGRCDQCE